MDIGEIERLIGANLTYGQNVKRGKLHDDVLQTGGYLCLYNTTQMQERLFRRSFRIAVEGELRWGDHPKTRPMTLALQNDVIIGFSEKTNNKGEAR